MNTRILISRNKREGGYAGTSCGDARQRHTRARDSIYWKSLKFWARLMKNPNYTEPA